MRAEREDPFLALVGHCVLEGTGSAEVDAVGSDGRIYTDEFPVYVASEWQIEGTTTPVVVATLYE
jgi:hypothetical protein